MERIALLAQSINKTDMGIKQKRLMIYYRVPSGNLESSGSKETRLECSNASRVATAASDKEISEKEPGDTGATGVQ